MCIMALFAAGLPGSVSPGTLAGEIVTPRARARNTAAPARRPGPEARGSRSAAISTATNAIHHKLITPSANSAAIIAHDELRQLAPARSPASHGRSFSALACLQRFNARRLWLVS